MKKKKHSRPSSQQHHKKRSGKQISPKSGGDLSEAIRSGKVQAKLKIGKKGDRFEQEADATADRVVNHIDSSSGTSGVQKMAEPEQEQQGIQKMEEDEQTSVQKVEEKEESPAAQKKEDEEGDSAVQTKEEEEPSVQRKEDGDQDSSVQAKEEEDQPVQKKEEESDSEVQTKEEEEQSVQRMEDGEDTDTVQKQEEEIQKKSAKGTTKPQAGKHFQKKLKHSKTGGNELAPDTRQQMEAAFGTDLGKVRIHTDQNAVEMNRNIQAKAFTHRNHIYFNSGNYDPQSRKGKHLLAHELTHTIQQGAIRSRSKIDRQTVSSVPSGGTNIAGGRWYRKGWGAVFYFGHSMIDFYGIRSRVDAELKKRRKAILSWLAENPGQGVLAVVRLQRWRTANGFGYRHVRFLSMSVQYGGKSREAAVRRWRSTPALLPGPATKHWEIAPGGFVWFPPQKIGKGTQSSASHRTAWRRVWLVGSPYRYRKTIRAKLPRNTQLQILNYGRDKKKYRFNRTAKRWQWYKVKVSGKSRYLGRKGWIPVASLRKLKPH